MCEYFQQDRTQWEENFDLSPEENEIAEDLIIKLSNIMRDYPLKIQWAAVYACQEEIERHDIEEIEHEHTKINGYQYLP